MTMKMAIVGAGIAGLATGFYGRMNGFETTILEAQPQPGGLCAGWTRKGYTFDTSMHMLTGSVAGAFHHMWQEMGVLDNRRFHYHTSFGTIEGREKRLVFSTDREKLREALHAISPDDAALSDEFVRVLCGPSTMGAASLKAPELSGPLDLVKMGAAILPLVPIFRRYGRTTIQDFAARFRDPFLRDAIRFCVDGPGWPMPGFPMAALVGFTTAAVAEAGVPIGGSHSVVREIAERYTKMGGELRLRTRVADLIVENDAALGVRLSDGSEVRADIVVWAADGHHLIYDLLGGRHLNDEIRAMYERWTPVQPMVQLMLGVARDMSGEPARLVRELAEPIEIAGESQKWITIVNRSFDPTSAPKGKTVLEVWYGTKFDPWRELAQDRARYRAEKKRIEQRSIDELDKRWPGIRAQIEVAELATPMTYLRYTDNWQGSPDGWYVTLDNFTKRTVLRTLPGLRQLYLAGQWTAPFTGTVMAALSGRQLIEILCKEQHRPFITCTKG